MLPGLLTGHQGARLSADAAGTSIEGPQALLVSNNPYEMTDIAGLGRRARLDGGTLGVAAVRVDSARQAIQLLRRGHGTELTVLTADQVTISADAPQIPVGIDGETVTMPAPVRCTIRPRALRVLLPRQRPGVPVPKPPLDWPRLRELASVPSQPRIKAHAGLSRAPSGVTASLMPKAVRLAMDAGHQSSALLVRRARAPVQPPRGFGSFRWAARRPDSARRSPVRARPREA